MPSLPKRKFKADRESKVVAMTRSLEATEPMLFSRFKRTTIRDPNNNCLSTYSIILKLTFTAYYEIIPKVSGIKS